MKNKIKTFVDRLNKIGIEVELASNYPWIYLHSVSGNRIKPEDYYQGNHGFTLAFYVLKDINEQGNHKFTNIEEIFKIIRKYR